MGGPLIVCFRKDVCVCGGGGGEILRDRLFITYTGIYRENCKVWGVYMRGVWGVYIRGVWGVYIRGGMGCVHKGGMGCVHKGGYGVCT